MSTGNNKQATLPFAKMLAVIKLSDTERTNPPKPAKKPAKKREDQYEGKHKIDSIKAGETVEEQLGMRFQAPLIMLDIDTHKP